MSLASVFGSIELANTPCKHTAPATGNETVSITHKNHNPSRTRITPYTHTLTLTVTYPHHTASSSSLWRLTPADQRTPHAVHTAAANRPLRSISNLFRINIHATAHHTAAASRPLRPQLRGLQLTHLPAAGSYASTAACSCWSPALPPTANSRPPRAAAPQLDRACCH
jgi:hypothetical protein